MEDDYIVTDENREWTIDGIISELIGDEAEEFEEKAFRAYANKLLDESEPFKRSDLEAAVASYSDGFSAGRKQQGESILQIVRDWDEWADEEGGEEKFHEKYGKGTADLIDIIEEALKEPD